MQAVFTGDHRYGDAAIFVTLFKVINDYLADPENFDQSKYKDIPHYSEKTEVERVPVSAPVAEAPKAEPVAEVKAAELKPEPVLAPV